VAVARPGLDPLTYVVPPGMALAVGHVVLVPLGRGAETGYVVELLEEPGFDPERVKPVERLVDPEPAFGPRQLEFFLWIADYYLHPLGMVIHTALPSTMQAKRVRGLEPTDEGLEALMRGEALDAVAAVLREVMARPGLTRRGLIRRLDGALAAEVADRGIESAVRRGFCAWVDREVQETRGRIRVVELIRRDLEALPRRASRQRAVAEALLRGGGCVDVRWVVAEQGPTAAAALRQLEEAGFVRFLDREDRDARVDPVVPGRAEPPPLNADQAQALAALTADDAAGPWLLFGVTGSGKTEVFLGAARHTLDAGRQVLVLVPEIGLTPQLVGRFRARFGDRVAVLHSGLTGLERLAEWRRIRAGEATVAVGARSALFAPFRDLGLVVVDEEHDDSYKQDDGLRYNARDLAVVLGRLHAAPVVLASATPSLESWHNARANRYRLLRLPRRATPRPVPSVEVIDRNDEHSGEGPRPLLHPTVVTAIESTLSGSGKVIVLYNRRGFATMVQCTHCGGAYECGNCGITMTLHRTAHVIACHYCGFRQPYDGRCPACHREGLEELGKGTERIEEELARLFPAVPIGRMDADTTAVRGSHHRILEDFRLGRTRMLIGTQIVAKGHDFPDVELAVVVSADHGLRLPDFRAAERTWAMVVQLAGRAGRGDRPGRVLVQTWTPEHYVLGHLDDAEAFYAAESRIRGTLRYPPYARLALLRIEGAERRDVQQRAAELARTLRQRAGEFPGVEVVGPSPAALARLQGRWRWQILLRGAEPRGFRAFLRGSRADVEQRTAVRVSIDLDPRHLM
jgi:primosomal protein N' (replication factor Y)